MLHLLCPTQISTVAEMALLCSFTELVFEDASDVVLCTHNEMQASGGWDALHTTQYRISIGGQCTFAGGAGGCLQNFMQTGHTACTHTQS